MKTFLQWAEEKGFDVAPVVTDTGNSKKATGENRIRTGITANYPDAYVRAQYPDTYYPPHKATAPLDLKQKAAKGYGGPRAAN